MTAGSPVEPVATYRSGVAARWLPRILAAAILAAAMLAGLRLEERGYGRALRTSVVLVGALTALLVVRRAGDVRVVFELGPQSLSLVRGAHRATLDLDRIERLRYDAPFVASRHWVPAAVVVDRDGRDWRLPATLEGGDRLVRDLVGRIDRDDLRAWGDALGLERRMGRTRRVLIVGYGLAALVLLAALVFYLR